MKGHSRPFKYAALLDDCGQCMLVMHFWDHGLVPSLLFAAINIILLGARGSLLPVGSDLQLSLSVVLGVACMRNIIQFS